MGSRAIHAEWSDDGDSVLVAARGMGRVIAIAATVMAAQISSEVANVRMPPSLVATS